MTKPLSEFWNSFKNLHTVMTTLDCKVVTIQANHVIESAKRYDHYTVKYEGTDINSVLLDFPIYLYRKLDLQTIVSYPYVTNAVIKLKGPLVLEFDCYGLHVTISSTAFTDLEKLQKFEFFHGSCSIITVTMLDSDGNSLTENTDTPVTRNVEPSEKKDTPVNDTRVQTLNGFLKAFDDFDNSGIKVIPEEKKISEQEKEAMEKGLTLRDKPLSAEESESITKELDLLIERAKESLNANKSIEGADLVREEIPAPSDLDEPESTPGELDDILKNFSTDAIRKEINKH